MKTKILISCLLSKNRYRNDFIADYKGSFMNDIIKKRIESLRGLFDRKKIDAIFILSDENRRYFSGFRGKDSSFEEHSAGLFITREKAYIITDARYDILAKQDAPSYEIICFKESIFHEITDLAASEKTENIGIESARLSFLNYKLLSDALAKKKISDIKLIQSDDILTELRIIKTEIEIEKIKKSLKIAETAFLNFIKNIKSDITEKEAAWEMEKEMRMLGADGLSFPVIAASGKNAAIPHAVPTERIIKKNEPVILDWGAKLDGYCSDITRSFMIGGANEKFKKIFDIVHKAQEKAISAAIPGIKASELDNIAREYIKSQGFQKEFSHSLGHGIGLCVHEPPKISGKSETILKSGMVFTIEPGIYLPNWGGLRLENIVAISETGAYVLNEINCTDLVL